MGLQRFLSCRNILHGSGQLAQERDQYADLSFRDALTGVYNRRALEETMERIPRARRSPC